MAASLLLAATASSAHALPNLPGGGGGGSNLPPELPDECKDPTTLTIKASPGKIAMSASATLSWAYTPPPECAKFHGLRLLVDGTEVARSGSRSVQPKSNSEYVAKLVYDPDPEPVLTESARILVDLPGTVDINGSTSDWEALLVQAVGTPNTTVRLGSGVDMDLSYAESIPIREGATLIGGQPCAIGAHQLAPPAPIIGGQFGGIPVCGAQSPQDPGPRLYTKSHPRPLFDLNCAGDAKGDNVRIAGFRLQGPHTTDDSPDGDGNLEQGIHIGSCLGVDIGNLEIDGWSGAAIVVTDPVHRRQTGPDAVRVHDSFIHHNQHVGGNGYGVDVSHGAWATIEGNVFDFNRHAVTEGAVGGYPVSDKGVGGNIARDNLVLKGGGYHGGPDLSFLPDGHDFTWTQQFDVHGDHNCISAVLEWLPIDALNHMWNCGSSGDKYTIVNNAFQYTHGRSFALRGTPKTGAFVDNNVFARSDDPVDTDGFGTLGLYFSPTANTEGVDTYGHYGACDIDGDGKDNLFLASGVSLWYMSAAKRQWTYLAADTTTLDQRLRR
jgi:hypothetical protein